METKKILQAAALAGAGYLVYRKFFASDASGEAEEDLSDDAVDSEDENEPEELAALNNPDGMRRLGKKPVGPLTRKIRNKKRKLAALRVKGGDVAKIDALEGQIAQLKAERLDKMVGKHGREKVRELMARAAQRAAGKVQRIPGVSFVASESIQLSGGAGTTSQEAEEDAIVAQLMAVAEIEQGA
jgi:hypothetical protein